MNKRKLLAAILFILLMGIPLHFTPLIKTDVSKIPVYFYSFSDFPIIKAKIEGSTYLLRIDLGSAYMLSLKKEALETIQNKKSHGTTEFMDIKGNFYQSPLYSIPFTNIGKTELSELTLKEENVKFLINGSRVSPSRNEISKRRNKELKKLDGRIGRAVFKNHYWFFDFPRSCLYFSNKKDQFKHRLRHLSKLSFTLEDAGVVLLIETDKGPKRFIIDTAATHSHLKKTSENSEEVHTQKFILGEENYGPYTLPAFELSDKIENVDGILGIDFLRKYAFYLDFETQTAYFQPPRKSLTQRLAHFFLRRIKNIITYFLMP